MINKGSLVGYACGVLLMVIYYWPYETRVMEIEDQLYQCRMDWEEPCTYLAVPDSKVELLKGVANQ